MGDRKWTDDQDNNRNRNDAKRNVNGQAEDSEQGGRQRAGRDAFASEAVKAQATVG